eukprot:13976707-Alexandrium_andersonii.AAC.1
MPLDGHWPSPPLHGRTAPGAGTCPNQRLCALHVAGGMAPADIRAEAANGELIERRQQFARTHWGHG